MDKEWIEAKWIIFSDRQSYLRELPDLQRGYGPKPKLDLMEIDKILEAHELENLRKEFQNILK